MAHARQTIVAMQDLRFAFRALWKDPGFMVPAVLALALSIGANTSVFTVVKSVLIEPLPMKQPEQLLAVYQIRPDGEQFPFNIPFYLDVRERSRSFQDVSAQGFWNANLTGEANPERLIGEPYTVIGVLPQSFSFRSPTNEFAVPLVIETDPFRDARISTAFLRVFARLKPGRSEEHTSELQSHSDLV